MKTKIFIEELGRNVEFEGDVTYIDDSFSYAGTHCTGGMPGIHKQGYWGCEEILCEDKDFDNLPDVTRQAYEELAEQKLVDNYEPPEPRSYYDD